MANAFTSKPGSVGIKFNTTPIALPSGDPVGNWTPQYVVVCALIIQPGTGAQPSFALTYDPSDSYIYQIPQDQPFDIGMFATNASKRIPPPTRNAFMPGSYPAEFVIDEPCYIVMFFDPSAQIGYNWQFANGLAGLQMGSNPAGKYSDLYHIQAGNEVPVAGVNNSDGCTAIYFSAATRPPPKVSHDPFNLYAQYQPIAGGAWNPYIFDPDIKNTGRPPGLHSHPPGT